MNRMLKYSLALACSVLLTGIAPAVWAQQVEEIDVAPGNTAGDTSNGETGVAASKRASSIVLETTSVTGSRELPKVLVIVPWKTSEALGPGERPLASLVEEALTPLDPDEFRREIDYYTELNDSSNNTSGSATAKDKSKSAESVAPE